MLPHDPEPWFDTTAHPPAQPPDADDFMAQMAALKAEAAARWRALQLGCVVDDPQQRPPRHRTCPHSPTSLWSAYVTYRKWADGARVLVLLPEPHGGEAVMPRWRSWQDFKAFAELTTADMFGKIRVVERIKADLARWQDSRNPCGGVDYTKPHPDSKQAHAVA